MKRCPAQYRKKKITADIHWIPPPRKVYTFKKADMNQVRDKCKQLCEYYTSQAQSHSASAHWNTLKNGLKQVIEENIPTKMIKEKHNLPGITQSIKRIVRRRKKARCKARRTRSIPDWERYKQLTTLMKRELKKAHSNHISNIFESNNAKKINKRAFGYRWSRAQTV